MRGIGMLGSRIKTDKKNPHTDLFRGEWRKQSVAQPMSDTNGIDNRKYPDQNQWTDLLPAKVSYTVSSLSST